MAKEYQTDDTCIKCGHQGMTVNVQGRVLVEGLETDVFLAELSCPSCKAKDGVVIGGGELIG